MAKDKNNENLTDLNSYKSKDNVSLGEMNFGLWLSEHRALLTRLVIIFLIVLSAVLFIYSAYQYFLYYQSNQNVQITDDNNLLSPRNLITDLKIESPQFFKNGDKYDLMVKVANPNDKFTSSFDACFNLNGQDFNCTKAFVLPGSSKYIFALGQDVKGDIRSVSFSSKNIVWQRLDAHAIPVWNDFLAARQNFAYTDINFYSINDPNYINQSNGNILEFNAKNLGSYSYYDVPLNIILYEGSQVVSINSYIVQNFLSGETRNVKIFWPGNFRNIRIEIVPDLNILDDSVYLKYQGEKTT